MVLEMAVTAVSVGLLSKGSCMWVAVFSNSKKADDIAIRSGVSNSPSTLNEIARVTTNR